MERLTKYDKVRKCYVIKPDAKQGENIQRLGLYEDRDEVMPLKDIWGEKFCPACDTGRSISPEMVKDLRYKFCPYCGQRLKE